VVVDTTSISIHNLVLNENIRRNAGKGRER